MKNLLKQLEEGSSSMQEAPRGRVSVSLVQDDFKSQRRWVQFCENFEIDGAENVKHLRLDVDEAAYSENMPMDRK
jgi:hypothetical protein